MRAGPGSSGGYPQSRCARASGRRHATDKLRDFTIKYADRILFGIDISDQPSKEKAEIAARRYHCCFDILDTGKIVAAGFYPGPGAGTKQVKGMALPIDVLEKIYYKNAVRLYPGVKDVPQQT
ncbi:MAG: hypothetical protein ACYSWO_09565 [Planctomycetota bacterium]